MASVRGKSLHTSRNLIELYTRNCSSAAETWFSNVKMGPTDAYFGIAEAFHNDKNPKKMNLGMGVYRDDDGKPFILPSVRKAEERIMSKNMDHEYAAINGDPSFYDQAMLLALGEGSPYLCEKSYAAAQSIDGTGALRVIAAFLKNWWAGCPEVHIPVPTWSNHVLIFEHAGMIVKRYRYYDPKNIAFEFNGCLEDVNKMPETSIILLHACAHNPTGIDPTPEQWCEMSELIKKKRIFPFFDMGYQGFASGDVHRDAHAVRMFQNHGHHFGLAHSFAKNMGLYGERVGALSIMCANKDEAARCLSQIKILIRALYSNPPIHGGRIVSEILNDRELYEVWLKDVKLMADRIIGVRKLLKDNLIKLGSQHPWDHITNQIGMFCFTGMTTDKVNRLIREFSIYLTQDGRISMAGVTSKNVEYLAQAIHEVTKDR